MHKLTMHKKRNSYKGLIIEQNNCIKFQLIIKKIYIIIDIDLSEEKLDTIFTPMLKIKEKYQK